MVNPFIQPDNEILNNKSNKKDSDEESTDSGEPVDKDEVLKNKIRKDLKRYIQRLKFSSSTANSSTSNSQSTTPPNEHKHHMLSTYNHYGDLSLVEVKIFETLERSIFKFINKWGKIIKYDQALTWIALGLAEWLPPIPKTSYVLIGRDTSNNDANHKIIKNLFDDYSNYIDNIPGLDDYLNELINDESINMSFQDVYERLVLVILHSPEERNKIDPKSSLFKNNSLNISTNDKSLTINKSTLPISGGTIEERVSFFIYVLRKLLPELSQYFQEEQILNKFGSNDDEWLIWWLKYGGSKVWSRLDRGRIWDSILGWRKPNKKNQRKNKFYYMEKLNISDSVLNKLGPDIFWSVGDDDETTTTNDMLNSYQLPSLIENKENQLDLDINRNSSFKNLMNELHTPPSASVNYNSTEPSSSSSTTSNTSSTSSGRSSSRSSLSKNSSPILLPEQSIPFSKIDPQFELIFIALALLKSKENTLVELDQHEIRQFLSRLPTKTYNRSDKYKQYKEQKDKEKLENEPEVDSENTNASKSDDQIITNDSNNNINFDFIDNIINEAGELWRKWLWLEMVDEN